MENALFSVVDARFTFPPTVHKYPNLSTFVIFFSFVCVCVCVCSNTGYEVNSVTFCF